MQSTLSSITISIVCFPVLHCCYKSSIIIFIINNNLGKIIIKRLIHGIHYKGVLYTVFTLTIIYIYKIIAI